MNTTSPTPPTFPTRPSETFEATAKMVVPCPPEVVFDYLAGLENNPEWNWAVTSTTALTAGPARSGSRYTQITTGPRTNGQMLEITELQRPHVLEVTSRTEDTTSRYRYLLHAAHPDDTRVSVRVAVQPGHPVGRPDLYVQRLQAAMRTNLSALRVALLAGQQERQPS